jgi:hypothetical protein
MKNINLFQSSILLIINKRKGIELYTKPSSSGGPRIMPWWAHSPKATLSRVYAFKSVDPFYLG